MRQAKHLIFLNLAAWLMMIPARPEMVLKVTGGNAIKTSQILGSMTAAAATFEFLVTAFLGRLSDKVGRKPMLLATSFVCFLFRFLDYLLADRGYKSVIAANWLDRTFAGACFPAFFTILKASISDVFLGEKLARQSASIGLWIGLGVMFGPVVGARVMGAAGNPKYTCLTACMFSLATIGYVATQYEETLPEEGRKEIDWSACSPLAFLEFFRHTAAMARLAVIQQLDSITYDMHDVKMVLLKTKLGLDADGIGKYMLGSGLANIFGGIFSGAGLKALGRTALSKVGGLAALLNFFLWGSASEPAQIAGALAADVVAGARGNSISSALTTHAALQNIGKGQIAAGIGNMSNLGKMVGPVTYTWLFGTYGQRAPFAAAASLTVLCQALIARLDRKDIEVDVPPAAAAKKEEKEEKKEGDGDVEAM